MNNAQYIIRDNTRAAMHMAVELCENGDFDSVTQAFRWLMQERDSTCQARVETESFPSEREAELEALVVDLYVSANGFNFPGWVKYYGEKFAELGIEVER